MYSGWKEDLYQGNERFREERAAENDHRILPARQRADPGEWGRSREKQDFIPNAGICINAPEFVGNVSGYENLMELAKIRKIAGKEEIMALCERFGLAEHIHKKYGK